MWTRLHDFTRKETTPVVQAPRPSAVAVANPVDGRSMAKPG
jgi:hypothetical protein